MPLVHLVLAHVSLVLLHVDAVLLGVEAERAILEPHAAAGEAAGRLVDVVLVLEARRHLREGAAAVFDVDQVNLVARALGHLAELGRAGLAPELLAHHERSGGRLLAGQEGVDRPRGALAVADRVDDDRRPVVGGVPAGEDAVDARLHRRRVHDEGLPSRQFRAVAVAGEAVHDGVLPDRRDGELAGLVELGSLDRHGTAAAGVVRLAELHPPASERLETTLLGDDPDRSGELEYLDALVDRVLDLHRVGGHLGLRAAIEDDHLVGAASPGGPGHVHGGVAAADHHDRPRDGGGVVGLLDEEIHAGDDALGLELPLDAHRLARPGAIGDEDGVVLPPELLHRDVFPDAHVVFDLRAGAADVIDLVVDDVVGEPVGGDPVAEHAARAGHRLVHDGMVSPAAEEPRGGEPRGPGADDPDRLARVGLPDRVGVVDARRVGDMPLDRVDADGAVDVLAPADDLALAHADAPADGRKRVGLADEIDGLLRKTHRREGDVALGVDVRRASLHAGRDAVGVVIGEQQLQRGPSRGDDPLVARDHFHPRRDARGAGGDEVGPTLHLDDAEEARTVGRELVRVAEGGDVVEAEFPDHLEDRLPGSGLDLLSVDCDVDLLHGLAPPTACTRRRNCSSSRTCRT